MAEIIERETALAAFRAVAALYQEYNLSSGTLGAVDVTVGSEVGKCTHSGNSQLVEPSHSDFICDFEITARRVLSDLDLLYFNTFYKTGAVVVQTDEQFEGVDELLAAHIQSQPTESKKAAVRSIDLRVRELIGRRCLEIGLYPPKKYLTAIDVRCERKPKIRWSHLY